MHTTAEIYTWIGVVGTLLAGIAAALSMPKYTAIKVVVVALLTAALGLVIWSGAKDYLSMNRPPIVEQSIQGTPKSLAREHVLGDQKVQANKQADISLAMQTLLGVWRSDVFLVGANTVTFKSDGCAAYALGSCLKYRLLSSQRLEVDTLFGSQQTRVDLLSPDPSIEFAGHTWHKDK